MSAARTVLFFIAIACCTLSGVSPAKSAPGKIRLLVVSSYHRDYAWSRDTHRGFCDAMLKFGYFENAGQASEYLKHDGVETSRVIVKKLWMDSKRKSARSDLARSAQTIYKAAREFQPHLIFLADDEAGEFVGRQFLDTKTPMVFWGFNDSPVKYSLVDTAARPGHNVTGVYQSGYYLETLRLLMALSPGVKTIAVLTDETVSGRTHSKALQYLALNGELPVALVDTVATNDYEVWKAKALELQSRVDAFYVVSFAGLKNGKGVAVPVRDVAAWYVSSITIPEATRGHYVREGLLCAADDSGYKQAYEAVGIAHDILEKGAVPATYPARTPSRGALMVNRARAASLGIVLTPQMGIEDLIDEGARQ
jgi:ABC-type uncharacterized transport system substrate-binding protein